MLVELRVVGAEGEDKIDRETERSRRDQDYSNRSPTRSLAKFF